MRIFFGIIVFLSMAGCTGNSNTLLKECDQGIGEACNKLGQELQDNDMKKAEQYYKKACDLSNTNGCVRYAELIKIKNFEEARRVLRYSCDRGNSTACVKFAELLQGTQK